MSQEPTQVASQLPFGLVCPKPVLLLHIPKTAGTSLLLTLQNAFGDNRVRRIHQVDEYIRETIRFIVETELDQVSCLAGHLPIHLFDTCLDQFQPFTVLREPVARVLSLYRFLLRGDPQEVQRLGLRPNFTLEEFLGSRHPELYSQINNGMVRMLCGDHRLDDPEDRIFWDMGDQVDALRGALTNLERIDFGLTEEMPATLALAQAHWAVPYRLREYRENTTTHDATSSDVTLTHQIIERNTMDLTLYHRAQAISRERTRASPSRASAQGWNMLSVFIPTMNQQIVVGDIPGRQGFHEFEPIGLAWLQAEQTGEVYVRLKADLVKLRMHLYCVIPDYPVADIVVSVNGHRVTHAFSFVNDKWGWLETDYFDTLDGLNRVTIQAPLFIPMAQLDPTTKDRRRLGIALAHLEVGS